MVSLFSTGEESWWRMRLLSPQIFKLAQERAAARDLGPCTTTLEPELQSPGAVLRRPVCPRARPPQWKPEHYDKE